MMSFFPLKHARELCIISLREKITQEGHSPPRKHTPKTHINTPTPQSGENKTQMALSNSGEPSNYQDQWYYPQKRPGSSSWNAFASATAEHHKMFIWTVCSTALTLGLVPLKAVIVLMFPDFLNH
jgi:hypothetical protein